MGVSRHCAATGHGLRPPGRNEGSRVYLTLPGRLGYHFAGMCGLTRARTLFVRQGTNARPVAGACRAGKSPVRAGTTRISRIQRPHRLVWSRTPAFHAGDTGSNPVGVAISFSPRHPMPPAENPCHYWRFRVDAVCSSQGRYLSPRVPLEAKKRPSRVTIGVTFRVTLSAPFTRSAGSRCGPVPPPGKARSQSRRSRRATPGPCRC